jgi:hypothetical protein
VRRCTPALASDAAEQLFILLPLLLLPLCGGVTPAVPRREPYVTSAAPPPRLQLAEPRTRNLTRLMERSCNFQHPPRMSSAR